VTSRSLVSVVVPVRDGADVLPRLVNALDKQTLPRERFEVVIADDGSAQPPVDFATEDGHVRVLPGPAVNSYAARNRGVTASGGDVLAFCDADCVPEADWLEQGLVALGSGDVVAGRIRFILPDRRTLWSLIDIDTSKNQEFLVSIGVAETANLFVPRELFDRLGGFASDDSAYGDYDLVERCVRSGANLRYAEGAVVWHPTRERAASLLGAQWEYCRGYAKRTAVRRRQVEGLKLRNWLPIVQSVRGRRQNGLALTIATPWLARNDVHPTWRERLLSLPLMYIVLPYWRNIAQLVGAIDGMRHRSEASSRRRRRS
jgi:glycosyltransferase involved in cell wall biosynthesis